MKFKCKYIPGLRPVPMIAIFNEVNKEVFDEIKKNFISNVNFNKNFSSEWNHIWNLSSYIIYDDLLEIKAFIYSDISYFFYLLRYLNKEIVFEIESSSKDNLKKELKNWIEEIKIL